MVSKLAIVSAVLLLAGAGLAAATYGTDVAITNNSAAASSADPSATNATGNSDHSGITDPCRWAQVRDAIVDGFGGKVANLPLVSKLELRGAIDGAHRAYLNACVGHEKGAASFDQTGSFVKGRYVSFRAETDGVTNYTSRGFFGNTRVFDSVTVQGMDTNGTVKGNTYTERDALDGLGLRVWDGPHDPLAIYAKNGTTVTFDLGAGIQAKVVDNGTTVVLVHQGHLAAIHAVRGTLTVNGTVVTASLGERGIVAFAVNPPAPALRHLGRDRDLKADADVTASSN
ncbi:MAG: hypothetical protein ACYDDF_08565 [Thermoplasmatota archaeon]